MDGAAQAQEGVSYEMLQELLRAERRSNKLSQVPPRFWHEIRALLQARMDAFRVEQAKDPFSRKVMLLTDEVKNAKHAAESLWALRERKLAMFALAGPKERKVPDGVTPDEGQFFQQIMEVLDGARSRSFEGIVPAPGAPVPAAPTALAAAPVVVPAAAPVPAARPSPAPPVPTPSVRPVAAPASPSPAAVPARAVAAPPPRVPSDVAGVPADLVTIRALGDIPPFVGPDMQTYLLKAGDVATVPKSIANLLVKRNKAAIVQE